MENEINSVVILGKPIDNQTRCVHYHSSKDIIAIKFKCCNQYFPCYYCHEETADHSAKRWSKNEWDTAAILCGSCHKQLTISEYFNSENHCPDCNAPFNPNCKKHYHYYFE